MFEQNVCSIRRTARAKQDDGDENPFGFDDFAWFQFVYSQTLVDVVFGNQTIEREEIETIGRETLTFRLSSCNFCMA